MRIVTTCTRSRVRFFFGLFPDGRFIFSSCGDGSDLIGSETILINSAMHHGFSRFPTAGPMLGHRILAGGIQEISCTTRTWDDLIAATSHLVPRLSIMPCEPISTTVCSSDGRSDTMKLAVDVSGLRRGRKQGTISMPKIRKPTSFLVLADVPYLPSFHRAAFARYGHAHHTWETRVLV